MNPNAVRMRAWRKKNKEKVREYKRKRASTPEGKLERRKGQLRCLYGITLEAYNSMLEIQRYCCAICEKDTPGKNHKHFSVDHDHETGEIRGLLCNDCNRGLGLLGDSYERLEKVLHYLKNNKEKSCLHIKE